MSLDTLANVKSRLGVTGTSDDALLNLLLDSADEWIRQHTGRDFAGGTFTEYFDGDTGMLLLANFPVTSVTSVKVDPAGQFGSETAVSASNYTLHSERGVIQSRARAFVGDRECRSPRAIQVVYTTASSSVPGDVKHAYTLIVGHWYRQVKTQVAASFQDLDSQRLGDVTATFTAETGVPREIHRLLAPYRTPVI